MLQLCIRSDKGLEDDRVPAVSMAAASCSQDVATGVPADNIKVLAAHEDKDLVIAALQKKWADEVWKIRSDKVLVVREEGLTGQTLRLFLPFFTGMAIQNFIDTCVKVS